MNDIMLKYSLTSGRTSAHHPVRTGLGRQLSKRSYLIPLAIAVGFAAAIAIWQGISPGDQPVGMLVLVAGVLGACGYFSARIVKAQTSAWGQKAWSVERETLEKAVFQAQAAAASANQAKAESIDRLSRAVRVHLNHILSTTELLMDDGLNDQQQEHLQEVRDASGCLANVISDGMDLSAIGSGKMELELINFNLRSCLEHVVEGIRPRAAGKHLDVEAIVDIDVPEVLLGDPGRLRQILGNLLGNAIKSADHGHLSLGVSCQTKGVGTARLHDLHFVVSDSGGGLSPVRQELLGKMFRNPSAFSDSDAVESALLISAQLVEFMGGRMWAQNQAGGGSEFHFTAGFRDGATASLMTTQTAVNLRGLSVLVAGSDAARINKLQQILNQAQMLSVSAQTAQAAMSILHLSRDSGKPIQLAILDDDLQDMDAFELSERITHDKTITTPAMFLLTANGQRGDASRCSRIGIAAYLAGPITSSILLNAIGMAICAPQDAGRRPLLTRHLLRELEIQHVLVDG